LFIDFRAAYDSIQREQLFKAMEELEIPLKFINWAELHLGMSNAV
jgi:hypothetical protein